MKKDKRNIKKDKKHLPLIWVLAILLGIGFIAFSPALEADFVYWDDDVNVYENPNVQSLTLENIKAIFTEDVIGNYNPLPILSFALEKELVGLTPFYFHLNNILLHILGCFLIYLIGFKMGLNRWSALLLSVLFAVHPMRAESVVWITERKDVLFALFYWLSILFYIKYKKEAYSKGLLFSLLIFPLALLSKIQAVALPLSLICLDYFFEKKFRWQQIYAKWPFFLLSLITGVLGIYFLSSEGSLSSASTDFYSLWERLIIGAYSYMVYLYKLVIPYPMSPLYPYPSKLDISHYLIAFLILPYLGSIYWLWKRKHTAVLFGLLFFTVNIIFVLQVVGAGQGFLADRFTYVGYFGFFFIASWYFQLYKGWKRSTPLAITLLILSAYMFATYQQSKIWKNSETLWTKVIQHHKKAPLPFRNRGNYYRDQNMPDKALQDYNEALRLEPDQHETYNSRGRLYFQADQLQKALQDYNKAIEQKPDKAEYYSNRGATYARMGQYEAAMNDFNQSIRLNPSHVEAYLNRAILQDALGRSSEAVADLERYLASEGDNADLLYNLAYFAVRAQQFNKAIEALNKAIRLDGMNGTYYQLRAKVYIQSGQMERARQDAQKAAQLGAPLEPSWLEQLEN